MRRTLILFAVLLVVVAAVGYGLVRPVGGMGAGFLAKQLCSAVFLSERPLRAALADEAGRDNPLVRFLSVELDQRGREVTATFAGLVRRTARYRDGLGCTLVFGELEDAAVSLPEAAGAGQPWPDGDGGVAHPLAAGVDSSALAEILDRAFDEPDESRPWRTRAVVVAFEGRLVAERYAEGWDAGRRQQGWSMAKSVTNALVGIRVGDGLMDPEAPAVVPAWAGDERARITLDQLLRMSSGLAFEERYHNPLADAPQMLFNRPDAGAYAATKRLAHPPDGAWAYSSGTTNIIQELLQATFPDREAYWRFPSERLFGPIGATGAVMEPDASGTFVGSSFLYATPRDWARLGQLYLQDGVWEGRRILPEGWVAYSTTPTPMAPRGTYGAQIWLNHGDPADRSRRAWPRVPDDAYWFSGFDGQWVVVVPSRRAVIVRLGLTYDESTWDQEGLVADILDALPR